MSIIDTVTDHFKENSRLKQENARRVSLLQADREAVVQENLPAVMQALTEQQPAILQPRDDGSHLGVFLAFREQAVQIAQHDDLYQILSYDMEQQERLHGWAQNRLKVETNEKLVDDGFGIVVTALKTVKNLGMTLSI